MANKKIEELDLITSTVSTDLIPVGQVSDLANSPKRITVTNFLTSSSIVRTTGSFTAGHIAFVSATGSSIYDGGVGLSAASIAETSSGSRTDLLVSPDGLAGSVYGKSIVEIALSGATALTTNDKGYIRIPSKINGWNLVGVAASCSGSSTSGSPVFTIKSGSQTMLSVNVMIDQGEFDSSTSGSAAAIDTAHDDVYTGNRIEVATATAGTGVTYAVVELQFQAP